MTRDLGIYRFAVWLLKFDVHFSSEMSTRCPIGHESENSETFCDRCCRFSVSGAKSQSRWPLSGQLAISPRLNLPEAACRRGVELRRGNLCGVSPVDSHSACHPHVAYDMKNRTGDVRAGTFRKADRRVESACRDTTSRRRPQFVLLRAM